MLLLKRHKRDMCAWAFLMLFPKLTFETAVLVETLAAATLHNDASAAINLFSVDNFNAAISKMVSPCRV